MPKKKKPSGKSRTKSRKKPRKQIRRARKQTSARKSASRKSRTKRKGRARGRAVESSVFPIRPRGTSPGAGGQSGDIQGLSGRADADSESIEELVEEGQAFEAGLIEGVEDSSDPDEAEVKTKEVLEDDVPSEYDDSE
jgi:hypothetical protein